MLIISQLTEEMNIDNTWNDIKRKIIHTAEMDIR